jgi:hypothetical protein
MNCWLRTRVAALFLIPAVVACATPQGRVGVETFGRGVLNLVLSPLMIASGLAQGLAFLPYTIGMGLAELNQALLDANAVSLDDSYKATFKMSMNDARVDQKTGEVQPQDGLYGRYKPEAIFEANRAFQRLLVSQGMPETKAHNYVLVGDYSYAWTRNQILLAVVYRHVGAQPFRTTSKTTGIVTTFRPTSAPGTSHTSVTPTGRRLMRSSIGRQSITRRYGTTRSSPRSWSSPPRRSKATSALTITGRPNADGSRERPRQSCRRRPIR